MKKVFVSCFLIGTTMFVMGQKVANSKEHKVDQKEKLAKPNQVDNKEKDEKAKMIDEDKLEQEKKMEKETMIEKEREKQSVGTANNNGEIGVRTESVEKTDAIISIQPINTENKPSINNKPDEVKKINSSKPVQKEKLIKQNSPEKKTKN